MLALALPALQLHLTGGDNRGVPLTTEATRGLKLLETTLGPGRAGAAPDRRRHRHGPAAPGPGHARGAAPAGRAAAARPRDQCPRTVIAPFMVPPRASRARRTSSTALGGLLQIRAAGKSDSGEPPAVDLVHRIRDALHPAARFPAGSTVLLTGAPAFGVDFVDTAYGAFPWLVLAVLVLSYLLLLRAFRSVFLPLKAVLMNLLSVSATYGVLVLPFQHGWGTPSGPAGHAADRGVDPDLPVRDALRPLDGLRGVPALADARGVGPHATTTSAASPTGSSTPAGSSPPPRSS